MQDIELVNRYEQARSLAYGCITYLDVLLGSVYAPNDAPTQQAVDEVEGLAEALWRLTQNVNSEAWAEG